MFVVIFAPMPPAIRYDIYGNIETPLSQEDKTFAYNTLEYTPQNKLTYIRARFYDSTSGTFISKDTYLGNIYNPVTTNRYAYCSGDPVNNMDLNGHFVLGLIAAVVAVVVVAVVVAKTNSNSNTGNSGGSPSGGGNKGGSSGTGNTNKGSTGGGSLGGGSSGGGGGYYYVPDPRQYYDPLVTGPYCVNNSNYYYIYNELSSKKTIKQLTINSSYDNGYYSRLYATNYNVPSKSEIELLINNSNKSRTTNSFGEVISDIAYYAMLAEPYLKTAQSILHMVPIPYLTPIVDGVNALADSIVLLNGAINTGKAISNLSNGDISTYDKVSSLVLGIGEIAVGTYGLSNDISNIKQDVNSISYEQSSNKNKTRKETFEENKEKGAIYENKKFNELKNKYDNAETQVYVKTDSGVVTRLDGIAIDENENYIIQEYKSSLTAPYTDNQRKAFPEIENNGATVIGKEKGVFKNGLRIPPTHVETIRAPN